MSHQATNAKRTCHGQHADVEIEPVLRVPAFERITPVEKLAT